MTDPAHPNPLCEDDGRGRCGQCGRPFRAGIAVQCLAWLAAKGLRAAGSGPMAHSVRIAPERGPCAFLGVDRGQPLKANCQPPRSIATHDCSHPDRARTRRDGSVAAGVCIPRGTCGIDSDAAKFAQRCASCPLYRPQQRLTASTDALQPPPPP